MQVRSGSIVVRLGRVVFWACSGFAFLAVAFIAYGNFFGSHKGDPLAQGAGIMAATLIWLFGRAFRYVVAGE
jgi:hypothetical protein